MFIYSIKASSLKFFTILGVATVLLIIMIFALPTTSQNATNTMATSEKTISYSNIKSTKDHCEFLSQFGWKTESDAIEEIEIQIPKDFDKVMNSYNNIQKNQGLDLSKYKNKKVSRYTYKITNYPQYEGDVYANIIVYKNKVIGGDVCSSDIKGFIHGFENPTELTENN